MILLMAQLTSYKLKVEAENAQLKVTVNFVPGLTSLNRPSSK